MCRGINGSLGDHSPLHLANLHKRPLHRAQLRDGLLVFGWCPLESVMTRRSRYARLAPASTSPTECPNDIESYYTCQHPPGSNREEEDQLVAKPELLYLTALYFFTPLLGHCHAIYGTICLGITTTCTRTTLSQLTASRLWVHTGRDDICNVVQQVVI